jgi:hypothetical protein
MSIVRGLSVALLALNAAGCGARSPLPDPKRNCTPLQIGMLGNPGRDGASDFQGWLAETAADVQRVGIDEPLTADALRAFDVVVFEFLTRDYTAEEAAAFSAWVAAGGGVVSMTGWDFHPLDDWHSNSLLAPLGVAYVGSLLNGPVTDLVPHPITSGLKPVVFDGGFAISDLGGEASTRTPIAFLLGNVPVGYVIQMGTGRAFVWGDEWIEYTSEASFQPRLWMQVLAWISAGKKRCRLLTPPS